MLQEERINEIRKKVIENKKVLVSELCKQYGLSGVTIRKDLQLLHKEGVIKKIYGGGLLNENFLKNKKTLANENNFKFHGNDAKEKVVNLALLQIQDGDTIFLGSGVTCSLLAKKLYKFKNLTVVTNNISALMDLISFQCKLYIIGGEVTTVDSETYFSSIENASQYLKTIYVSKAFTSCSGIDLNAGITVNSIISTYIYRNLSDINRRWYMLVDNEKFGRMGIYKIADLNQIDYIISNTISKAYSAYFKENGIKYLTEKNK